MENMAKHKTSKGVTPKSVEKIRYIDYAMIVGLRPRDAQIVAQLSGADFAVMAEVGAYRWYTKQKIASEIYNAVIQQLPDIEYIDRYKVRSLVQLVVMKALRFAESGERIPWTSIEMEARTYNALKLKLPEEYVTRIIETAKKALTEEVIAHVVNVIKRGTVEEVKVSAE